MGSYTGIAVRSYEGGKGPGYSPPPGKSPIILNDPAENFTYGSWTTVGTPTIASARTGNGFSFPAADGHSASYDIPISKQTDTLTFGAWVKWAGLFGVLIPYFQWRSDSGVTLHMDLRFDSGGFTACWRGTPAQLIGNNASPTGITTGNWFFIESMMKLGDVNAGSFIVKVNGSTINTRSNDDTFSTGGVKSVFDQFRIISSVRGNMIVDDIYLRNDGNFGSS